MLALVRWPPMGRRKLMLDNQLRGRNELVADSIQKETGVPRDRKQVSSHIQVHKKICADQPLSKNNSRSLHVLRELIQTVLMYMGSKDDEEKKKRRPAAYLGHSRSRHQPTALPSKYPLSQSGTQAYGAHGMPYPHIIANTHTRSGAEYEAPFTLMHFAMLVRDRTGRELHRVTELANKPRLPDTHFTDLNSWHKQYPELTFHRTDEWKDRQVLVCHASINMTEKQPSGAELAIEYVLDAHQDLSAYEPLQCRTRFFDSGELAHQYDEKKQCGRSSKSTSRLPFGSQFWVRRMSELRNDLTNARKQEDQNVRRKLEMKVQRSLQYMTGIQEVYGTRSDTGEEHCFLTILWRFHQTRSSSEPGRVTWRSVTFPPPAQHAWMKGGDFECSRDLKLILNSTTSLASDSIYTSLPLDLSHQPFAHHPPPLDLDTLSNMPMDVYNDFSNPNSATTHSMSTDYSQTHSLPSLTHSQDTQAAHSQDFQDPNEIDFNGGHITMHLGPPIDFGTYDNYGNGDGVNVTGLPGLETSQSEGPFGDLGLGMGMSGGGGIGAGATMANCYPSKPWHYSNLISHLEGAAEQGHGLLDDTNNNDQDIVGHGVLHDGQLGNGLWKLQSGFTVGEDTGVGACSHEDVSRKESAQGILELIERGQRMGGY